LPAILPQILPDQRDFSLVAFGLLGDLLQHADRGQVGILGEQGVDLGLERIEDAPPRGTPILVRRLREGQGFLHRAMATAESSGGGPLRQTFDLGQAANLRPLGDFHGGSPGSLRV
jgi:hypothetical protein